MRTQIWFEVARLGVISGQIIFLTILFLIEEAALLDQLATMAGSLSRPWPCRGMY